MKKRYIAYPLLLASLFSLGCYLLFFNTVSITPNHTQLPLMPNTLREQNDLILVQEQEAQSLQTGPLILQISAADAQQKVLMLHEESNP